MTMSDESTGGIIEATEEKEGTGGGALDDLGKTLGSVAGDVLGGGASSGVDDWIKEIEARGGTTPEPGETGPRVWDEKIPDDLPNPTGILPRKLDPDTAAQQNASQAESRQKAIDEGLDPQTAQLVYPEIDPNDPYKIN